MSEFIDPLDELFRVVSIAQHLAYCANVEYGHKLLIQALDVTSVSDGEYRYRYRCVLNAYERRWKITRQ